MKIIGRCFVCDDDCYRHPASKKPHHKLTDLPYSPRNGGHFAVLADEPRSGPDIPVQDQRPPSADGRHISQGKAP